ncbi:transposase family protein [Streptomyces sp. NPDC001939]
MPASCPASPALDQFADFARWEAELHTSPTETQSALVKRRREVPDRQGDKGRRHPLVVILKLTACATLVVGSDSIAAIWQWAARFSQDVLARSAPASTPSAAAT